MDTAADFVEELEHATVALGRPGGARPCPRKTARPERGGLFRGPMTPSDRFVCDAKRPWLWVGATVIADLDQALADGAPARRERRRGYAEEVLERMAGWRAEVGPRLASDEVPINMARLMQRVREAPPDSLAGFAVSEVVDRLGGGSLLGSFGH